MDSDTYLRQLWTEREAEKARLADYIAQRHHVYGNWRLGTTQAQERAEELDHLIEYSTLLIADTGERICDEAGKAREIQAS